MVIVGGGFAGLWAARALASAPVRVTLVDRSNHHLFQPLLYQVATAGLSAPDIAAPLRHILRRPAQRHRAAGARSRRSTPTRSRVRLADGGALDYDYLVLATGATHAYFGHDDWAAHAPGLKTLDDALEIRRRVLSAFEAAEREADRRARDAWLTFVVVGGGPTGVELAGALAEIARHTLRDEFRRIDPRQRAGAPGRGRRARAGGVPADRCRRARAGSWKRSASRCAPARAVTRSTPTACCSATSGCRRARCCGPPASPPRRWRAALGVPLDRAGRVPVAPRPVGARPRRHLRRRRPGAASRAPTAGRCPASRRPRSRWARTPRA